MLCDVEKGNDLMLTRLTPVAALIYTLSIHKYLWQRFANYFWSCRLPFVDPKFSPRTTL